MSREKEIRELEREIRRHNRLYFREQRPEISDLKFDQLVRRLKELVPDSPVLSEIPTDSSKGGKKVRHSSPMLSLDKAYSEKEVLEWAEKFEGELIASPKIDGSAAALRYNPKGELIRQPRGVTD